ncbi:MAG: hypothetical protein EXR75_16345 [Myxococcales bacterium]|nr:hypothetical protein [Myxococcales bacterium]
MEATSFGARVIATCAVPLAWIAVFSALIVRGFEPALPGVWTGVDDLIDAVKVCGAFLAQLGGVGAALLFVFSAVRIATGDREAGLRAMTLGIAGISLLALSIASGALSMVVGAVFGVHLSPKLPLESVLIQAGSACLFALVAARASLTALPTRGPALVLFGAAIAVALRLFASLAARPIEAGPSEHFTMAARAFATAGTAALALVSALALLGLALAPRQRRVDGEAKVERGFVRLAAPLAAGIFAAALAWLASQVGEPESARSAVFAGRLVDALAAQPRGWGPPWLAAFAEALRYAAIFAVLARGKLPARTRAVIALALLGSGLAVTPLGAVYIALAAALLAGASTAPAEGNTDAVVTTRAPELDSPREPSAD